jgi:predicted nucleotidyltransferase
MDQSTIIRTLREHERELRSAGVEHLLLFGSWARGTAVQAMSDIDLIAEFDAGREYSLLDRVQLENRLADMLGAKVDLAPLRMLKDGIRERAMREAVPAF